MLPGIVAEESRICILVQFVVYIQHSIDSQNSNCFPTARCCGRAIPRTSPLGAFAAPCFSDCVSFRFFDAPQKLGSEARRTVAENERAIPQTC